MKHLLLKTALSCGLALCVSPMELLATTGNDTDGTQPADPQSERGGGRGGGNGGGRSNAGGRGNAGGGSQSQSPRGGGNGSGQSRSGSGHGGRSGIHAPSVAGPRNVRSRGGSPSSPNRTPSFSRPVVPTATGSGSRGPIIGRSTLPSRIGIRPFTGNTVSFNNRNFHVGNDLYQPSHYRHSGYHGYWNGNRRYNTGNNAVSALAYGLGYGSSDGNGNYRNYNGYSSGWGWGLANGYGGSPGYRSYSGYGYRPVGWGLGGWGLGSLIYNSGYLGYSNPYYISSGTTVYNYTQPIPVYYNAPITTVVSDPDSADAVLSSAVEAFRQNDYDRALDITNKGISRFADDAVLHEFRSLVLFAKQDYQQSAATIHSVLAVGPGWDWTTLIGMHSSVEIYTAQLRELETHAKSNSQDAASQFLLAYHYMTCGHPDAAARRLQQVLTLRPDDRVAADLLRMIAPPDALTDADASSQRPAPQPIDPATETPVHPIDPGLLTGAWRATRDDGSVFNLTMTEDARFTWSYAPNDQAAQEFDGTYTLEENILALERTNGGSLIAEVIPHETGKFNFRLVGTTDDDKGLEFSK